MYIPRSIEEDVKSHLHKGKVIVIYGARQVGKTTLVKKIAHEIDSQYLYFSCDEPDTLKQFQSAETSTALKNLIGNSKLIIIDEAQLVPNIGIKLKLLVDNYPDQQVIATGSSSFELADSIVEPLTGRNFQFWLYPLSVSELNRHQGATILNRNLDSLLIYGSYPAVINADSLSEKTVHIRQITAEYLYKDVLKFLNLKSEETAKKTLEALALQIGGEVSYNELGNLIGVSKQTVESYLDILEKAFIIFRLTPLSRNLRKEIGRMRKIYFYDLGIRNALINNFNPLSIRADIGQLWENFMVLERRKQQYWFGNIKNNYFWRTYDQQEIDLVEEQDGQFVALEAKWKSTKSRPPVAWTEAYPNSKWNIVNKDNFLEFLS